MIPKELKQEKKYIQAVDVAKYVRKALKRAFVGVKFSVRTQHHTSIRIAWIDGPTEKMVKAITGAYVGGGFDGMIDLAYGVYSWLNPKTGEAAFAYTNGTGGNGGLDPAAQSLNPWPDVGILVSFGSKHISLNRRYTQSVVEKAVAAVVAEYNFAPPKIYCYAPDSEWESWEVQLDRSRDQWEERKLANAASEYDAYEPPQEATKAIARYEPSSLADNGDGIEVKHERDWTWIYYSAYTPSEWEQAALKSAGAKLSPKRTRTTGAAAAWFVKERLDLAVLLDLLRAAHWADYKKAHPDFTDPNEPLGPGGGPGYGDDRAEIVRADFENLKPVCFA